MAELQAGMLIGTFRIVRLIQHGGSGAVYEALDTRDNQRLALKIPDSSYLGDIPSWERFRREVSLARRLKHRNVAAIKEASDDPTHPYLAVEYVQGEDLETILQRDGPLPVDRVIALGTTLADVLQYIHSEEVVHRDLKPANLMIGRDGVLKLVDFGIARPLQSRRITWKGLSKSFGTPSYMAPEQVQGGNVSPQTDLYAFGAILYALLSGAPPFQSENIYQVMNWQVNRPIPPLRPLRHDVPEWLEKVVLRALEKKPQHRYRSAAEMAKDLSEARAPAPLPEVSTEGSPRLVLSLVAGAVAAVSAIVGLALLHHH